MKSKKTTIEYSAGSKSNASRVAKKYALGSLAMAAAAMPLTPTATQAADAPPPSRVNFLANFDFSNEYLTPRGMIVHDQGLAVQPLLLGFVTVDKRDSFINDVTLVPGVWNDF